MHTTIKQKIGLIVFGVIVTLLLLEVGLRVTGCIYTFFVDKTKVELSSEENPYTIVCLGESTTQGEWPQYFYRLMQQRVPQRSFRVIDAGKRSVNSAYLVSRLEQQLNHYTPDMVIVMMGVNDLGDALVYDERWPTTVMLYVQQIRLYKLAKIVFQRFSAIVLWLKKEQGTIGQTDIDLKSTNGNIDINAIKQDHMSDKGLRSVQYAREQMQMGKFIEAEKILLQILKKYPALDEGHEALLKCYLELSEFDKLNEAFERAVQINPNNDELYALYARSYELDYLRAKELYEQALKLNKDNIRAHDGLGDVYLIQKEYALAVQEYEKVLQSSANKYWTWVNAATCYQHMGDYEKAKAYLKQAIRLEPDKELAFTVMEKLYTETSDQQLKQWYSAHKHAGASTYYVQATKYNYMKLKEMVLNRGIRLVCVQYPLRNVEELRRLLDYDPRIIFVDNEGLFKKAVANNSYDFYFRDTFAKDFGHCTSSGNELLAQHIADVVCEKVFSS